MAMPVPMVSENALVMVWLSPPVNRTVKLEAPEPVGVPLITPAVERFRPVGNVPETRVQVNAGVLPDPARV